MCLSTCTRAIVTFPNRFHSRKNDIHIIFTCFSQKGFDVPMNEVDYLRRRLAEEQDNVQRVNEAKQEVETRCQLAERERDIYKTLARKLRSRLNSSLPDGSNNSNEFIGEIAAEMILGEREPFSSFGLAQMLRIVAQERNDEEMLGEDVDEDFEFSEEENDDDDDNNDDMSEAMDDIEGDDEEDSDGDVSLLGALDPQNPIVDGDSTLSSDIRSQNRTVSISQDDM